MDYIYKKEQHILYPNWEWTRYVISFIMIVCLDNLQKKKKLKKSTWALLNFMLMTKSSG